MGQDFAQRLHGFQTAFGNPGQGTGFPQFHFPTAPTQNWGGNNYPSFNTPQPHINPYVPGQGTLRQVEPSPMHAMPQAPFRTASSLYSTFPPTSVGNAVPNRPQIPLPTQPSNKNFK